MAIEVFVNGNPATGPEPRPGTTITALFLNALEIIRDIFSTTVNAQAFNDGVFNHTTINEAILEIDGDQRTLFIGAGTWNIGANLTIPENITIVPENGTNFNVPVGIVLTILADFKGGLTPYFSGLGSVVFGPKTCTHLHPEWWGAVGDDIQDDGVALQRFFTCIGASAGPRHGRLLGKYATSIALTLPEANFKLTGISPETTWIRHTSTTFEDILTIASGSGENVVIEDFSIRGRGFLTGCARFGIYAENLHDGSRIRNVMIRNCIGTIKIVSCYLADIDIVARSTVWRLSGATGVTQSQWEEVWGPNNAPIWLGEANASRVRVHCARVGSEVEGGVTPFAYIYLNGGTALSLECVQMEWDLDNYDTFTQSAVVYSPRVQHGIYGLNIVASIRELYLEKVRFETAILLVRGNGAVNLGVVSDYQTYCLANRIVNNSGQQIVIDSYQCWDARGAILFKHYNSGISLNEGFSVRGGSLLSGCRYEHEPADGGPNSDNENVVDTFSFAGTEKLGIASEGVQYPTEKLYIPKIQVGYVVTTGSDPVYNPPDAASVGHYVQITCGVMMLSSGRIVEMKKWTREGNATANTILNRLRPITASRWYRVFVGELGNPYLVEYPSDPVATPEGDWIAGFQTDGSLAITGLATNPRLAYIGFYQPGSSMVVAIGSAVPVTGYWRVGDTVWNTAPSASTPFSWTCTTAGSQGTWTADDNFSGKSLAAVNLNLSGVLQRSGTQILTSQQTGMGATLGAATAGATYTATEQALLQAVYNKMVSMETRLKIHGLIAT